MHKNPTKICKKFVQNNNKKKLKKFAKTIDNAPDVWYNKARKKEREEKQK